MIKKVGLTGNIASGKTTISKIFEMLGVGIFYADKEAHVFLDTEEVREKIINLFGSKVVTDNKVNRKALANIVFNSQKALSKLNSIIHPLVLKEFEKRYNLYASKKNYIIFESAIIFESDISQIFDEIILVTAPVDLRIKRAIKRDNSNKNDIIKRINNQIPDSLLLSKAKYHITNDDKSKIIPQILAIDKALEL